MTRVITKFVVCVSAYIPACHGRDEDIRIRTSPNHICILRAKIEHFRESDQRFQTAYKITGMRQDNLKIGLALSTAYGHRNDGVRTPCPIAKEEQSYNMNRSFTILLILRRTKTASAFCKHPLLLKISNDPTSGHGVLYTTK